MNRGAILSRCLLVFLALAPLSSLGHEKQPVPEKEVTDGPEPSSGPDGNPQQQGTAKPHKSAKPRSEPRPNIPLSMVGYVDDATVATQVRVRFDASFHDSVPDRAEFFYPPCG